MNKKDKEDKPAKPQVPGIGRIVHYRGCESDVCVAAVITDVSSVIMVSLTAFYTNGNRHHTDVSYNIDAEHPEDTWHWPEKAEKVT